MSHEHCTHCNKVIDPKTAVELELQISTSRFVVPGSEPWCGEGDETGGDSQGCWLFGPDCAKRILKGTKCKWKSHAGCPDSCLEKFR